MTTSERSSSSRAVEAWALGLLTVGLITGPLGLIIGLVLVGKSSRWTYAQKYCAAAIPLALFGIFLAFAAVFGGRTCFQVDNQPKICEDQGTAWVTWLVVAILAAFVAAAVIYLARAARNPQKVG